jgi:hypothetical protein
MNSRTTVSDESLMRMYLDHGVDEATCSMFRLEEHGVTFHSPWEFPLMAEMSICVDFRHPERGRCRTPVCGVVVGSSRTGAGRFETTVLFVGATGNELPAESDLPLAVAG